MWMWSLPIYPRFTLNNAKLKKRSIFSRDHIDQFQNLQKYCITRMLEGDYFVSHSHKYFMWMWSTRNLTLDLH